MSDKPQVELKKATLTEEVKGGSTPVTSSPSPSPVPSAADEAISDRKSLILKGLENVLGETDLDHLLSTGQLINLYWGTATTGIPSIGYLSPLNKMKDYLIAGLNVTILFADFHAFLDNMKSSLEEVKLRAKVYELVIKGALEGLGEDPSNIKFVLGSSFQATPAYQLDLLRLTSITTDKQAKKAGAEVVKQSTNPLLSSLIYPLMQALDEKYLGAHIQFGGIDQVKIFGYARDFLPKLGIKPAVHLMNPIISALSTVEMKGVKVKMSSSDKNGKISLLDNPKDIRKKVSKHTVKMVMLPIIHHCL